MTGWMGWLGSKIKKEINLFVRKDLPCYVVERLLIVGVCARILSPVWDRSYPHILRYKIDVLLLFGGLKTRVCGSITQGDGFKEKDSNNS